MFKYSQVFDSALARLKLNALATVVRIAEAGDQNLRRPWTPDEMEDALKDAVFDAIGAMQFADTSELEPKVGRVMMLLEDLIDSRGLTVRRCQAVGSQGSCRSSVTSGRSIANAPSA